ncbi:MAG: hypothetical protein VXX10_07695 [Pseudomonadota bacterium]|nr:hypothetical protein [Pseudomonadota bacterium]
MKLFLDSCRFAFEPDCRGLFPALFEVQFQLVDSGQKKAGPLNDQLAGLLT